MLDKGIKISAGTDATRVASYNPWVSLAWLVTGKTVGGMQLYPQRNCLDRETALRMWTENVTWFSNEEGKKGRIEVGQLADLIVPDRDFFSCAEDEIADTTSRSHRRRRQDRLRRRRFCAASTKTAAAAGDARLVAGAHVSAVMAPGASRTAPTCAGQRMAMSCGCANQCNVHGHDHATAWSSKLPIADLNRSGARWAVPAGRCDHDDHYV